LVAGNHLNLQMVGDRGEGGEGGMGELIYKAG